MQRFPQLPPELRLMIWRLAVESRLVRFDLFVQGGKRLIRAPTPQPMLLQVNRESRAEMLSCYRRIITPWQRLNINGTTSYPLSFHGPVHAEPFVESYFNPAVDTLCFGKNGPNDMRHAPDSETLMPLIRQARARHIRLLFWPNDGWNAIVSTEFFETLTVYTPYNCNSYATLRMVRTRGLPRTAVASIEPLSASNSLARPWTFAPVRELFIRDDAVLFDHRTKSQMDGLAWLLVVDQTTFPDEFIWGLAASAKIAWRHDSTHNTSPTAIITESQWLWSLYQLVDGVCVPSFGLGGEPPYACPGWDRQRQVDAAIGIVASTALLGLGLLPGDEAYFYGLLRETERRVWMEAILWRKGIESWEEAKESGEVEIRGATMGGIMGIPEREEIEEFVDTVLDRELWKMGKTIAQRGGIFRTQLGNWQWMY